MDATHAQLAYFDPQFNFILVNAAYARGSGYSRQELIGRNHFDLFPHAENQAIFERVRDTGEPVEFHAKPFEFSERPELGTTYWDWTLVPVKGADGQVQGLLLSLLDVTEQERVRRTLRRYADRLEVLHETDQAILAARSVDEIAEATLRYMPQLVDCLRASVAIFDLEAGEMSVLATYAEGTTQVGTGWRGPLEDAWIAELDQGEIHAVEDIQSLSSSSELVEALRAEEVRAFVNVPIVIGGELTGSLNLGMHRPGHLTSGQMDIVREIADQLTIAIQQARLHEQVQRHADVLEEQVTRRTRALRSSQARFRTIFEGAGFGMALVDGEGRLEEANLALQQLVGHSAEELRGRVFTEFIHPEDTTAAMELYQELIAGQREPGSYRKMEGRYLRRDGQARWASLTVSPVRRGPGGRPAAVIIVEDVTEQRQVQAALVQSEKLAITGRLAASLAHEINNPLQSIIGCLGLAEESLAEGKEDDARQLLEIATEELERAAGVVAQLRDLSRRSRPEDREPTDVNALVEQVLMLTDKQCQNQEVEVVWRAADDLPSLMLVPDRMQQVFLNLVLNAVEAMSEGGELRVSTSRVNEPAGVQISFADNGRGIAPDDLHQIFDPFFTTKPEGLGLGLYVTRNIVEEHGGEIGAQSQLGEGSTFTVWLPA
jgi:PAS domain S-box-containing protein